MGTNHYVTAEVGYRFTFKDLVDRLVASGALLLFADEGPDVPPGEFITGMQVDGDPETFEPYELADRIAGLAGCSYSGDSSQDLSCSARSDWDGIHVVFCSKGQHRHGDGRSTAGRLEVGDGYSFADLDEMRHPLDGLAEALNRVGLDCRDVLPGVWLTANSG